jgi:hypothetical protein
LWRRHCAVANGVAVAPGRVNRVIIFDADARFSPGRIEPKAY